MKLRHDKGKPLIVLEAGDVSCLERAAGLLAGASVHVGEFPDGTLQDLSDGLRKVLRGEVNGVQLPRKRKQETNGGTTDTAPGESHVVEEPPFHVPRPALARKTGPKCAKCNEPLSKGELRHERDTCLLCDPVQE